MEFPRIRPSASEFIRTHGGSYAPCSTARRRWLYIYILMPQLDAPYRHTEREEHDPFAGHEKHPCTAFSFRVAVQHVISGKSVDPVQNGRRG